MNATFKVVDIPKLPGGQPAQPNPFEPAAKAAIQAQEQGKAIAFPLDVKGFKDTERETDGKKVTVTARENAAAYVTRKIRELGKPMDRTFTVVVEHGEKESTVTVAAKARITRAKKASDTDAETVTVPDAETTA